MVAIAKPEKPRDVGYAQTALWAWTVWACLYGIFETWRQIPDIEDMLNTYLQDMIQIAPNKLLEMAIGMYLLIAVVSGWIIVKIGQGRHWARSSLIWGLVLEIATTFLPPYHAPAEYLSDIPDIGLQGYALYYLYTRESREWFETKAARLTAK